MDAYEIPGNAVVMGRCQICREPVMGHETGVFRILTEAKLRQRTYQPGPPP